MRKFSSVHLVLRRIVLIVTILCICSAPVLSAQSTQQPVIEPLPSAPQISPLESIKKTVVFIEGDYEAQVPVIKEGIPQLENGKPKLERKNLAISGTGFIITKPEPKMGADQGQFYLVTNKHMVREPGPDGRFGEGPYLRSIKIRANTLAAADGGDNFLSVGQLEVTDENRNLVVFVHPDDPDVDLAIFPIAVDQKITDFKSIPISVFATADKLITEHADESTEVIFAGLFASFLGSKKNYPIVRHGKLAMIASERIPWTKTTTADLYLADVMSFGGNSGSPVFLRLGGATDQGTIMGYHYLLLGVMQGYFPVDSKVVVETAQATGTAAENTGIAAVIPAQKIIDILNSPRAEAFHRITMANTFMEKREFDSAMPLYKESIEQLSKLNYAKLDLHRARLTYADALKKAGNPLEAAAQEKAASQIDLANKTPDDRKK